MKFDVQTNTNVLALNDNQTFGNEYIHLQASPPSLEPFWLSGDATAFLRHSQIKRLSDTRSSLLRRRCRKASQEDVSE